jgi:hypothetical protein
MDCTVRLSITATLFVTELSGGYKDDRGAGPNLCAAVERALQTDRNSPQNSQLVVDFNKGTVA